MIILNSKKINTLIEKSVKNGKKISFYLKELLQDYFNINNFGPLECPHCHSSQFLKWGFYIRNIIFFGNDGVSLESYHLSVQRVRCKSCGKTHALLPFGIIPYKQFSDEVISKVFYELLTSSTDDVSSKYLIDPSIIKNWKYQLKEYHLPFISTLFGGHNTRNILNDFLMNIPNKLIYINVNHYCFMQIKMGILGLCPS